MIATEAICLTVDVEWAHPVVLADLVALFDQRGLRATFFCTHAGIDVPGHERGLHPNFRGDGDCMKALVARDGADAMRDQAAGYRFAMDWFHGFAPEAIGVRGHSLHYDSQLLAIYRAHGIQYDSSYQLPLAAGLRPFWKEAGILELPLFYNDFFDIRTQATGFYAAALNLHRPGLKVLNLHPNIVYANIADPGAHERARAFHHDPARLLAARGTARGPRDLLQSMLDDIAARDRPTATLAEVAAAWRARHPAPWP